MPEMTASPFNSAPWCFNGHAHTILTSQLFTSPKLDITRLRIDTSDGDEIEISLLLKDETQPFILLLHGLEGNSKRYYITRLASHLKNRNFNVLMVNFRSCGSRLNRTKRFYHSGETDDLHTVITWLHSQYPNNQMAVAGFSLGGSVVLNYLKKYQTNHPLTCAVSISTPFDLKKSSLNLNHGFNRIYQTYFLLSLKKKINLKRKQFSELPLFKGSTLYEFDDQFTAPIHGFESAEHYYRQCSSTFFMDKIKTKTLLIHSREDPLCPFQFTPAKVVLKNPAINSLFTKRGGHVGFWSNPPGWLNYQTGKFISGCFE